MEKIIMNEYFRNLNDLIQLDNIEKVLDAGSGKLVYFI